MRRVHSKPAALRGFWPVLAALACLAFAAPIAVYAGGASDSPTSGQTGGPQIGAERLTPDQLASPTLTDAVIGPQDALTIRVFEVKDLTFENEQVDSSGAIMLPLIGKLQAAGKTPGQLESEIAQRLSKYLQDPQVTVSITMSASQKVTIEGNVKTPGVFLIHGKTTLMQTVAMAGGPDSEADLHKVAVIRYVNGVRSAATVDYLAVRAGKIGDPIVQGDDVVVVGESTTKMVWANFVRSLPVFSLMAVLR